MYLKLLLPSINSWCVKTPISSGFILYYNACFCRQGLSQTGSSSSFCRFLGIHSFSAFVQAFSGPSSIIIYSGRNRLYMQTFLSNSPRWHLAASCPWPVLTILDSRALVKGLEGDTPMLKRLRTHPFEVTLDPEFDWQGSNLSCWLI